MEQEEERGEEQEEEEERGGGERRRRKRRRSRRKRRGEERRGEEDVSVSAADFRVLSHRCHGGIPVTDRGPDALWVFRLLPICDVVIKL